ncbi:MAG TPA: flagellin, partial [Candidatus Baltobacteraceae bacterium]|nr:flagellin [Candidatus Baltobacteraceae bacterium]
QTAENVLAIGEGALNNINDILLDMRDLVVQASSDTLGTTERAAITNQITSLNAEIDRIASRTSFDGVNLLDGTFTNKRIQTGDTGADSITLSIGNNFAAASIGVSLVSVTDSTMASNSLASVDAAITIVTGQVQDLGSTTQRLRLIENNMTVAITNTTAAKSRILDADVAQEQANSTRLEILRQLATAQLAQANTAPQSVLALFK